MDSLVEVELFERADGLEPRGLGEGRIEQSKLRRGELVHHLGTEYEIDGVMRAAEGEARPRVFLVRTVSTAPPTPMLRFVIGSNYMVSGQFRVFHGEKEVTELLDIKTMRMELDADARGKRARTRIHVELLAEAEISGETDLAGYLLEVNRVRTALGLEPLPCDHTSSTRYVGCGGKAFWICDGCEQVVTRAEREWWPDSDEARAAQYGMQRYQLHWGVQSLGQGWFHPSAVEVGKEIECGARGRFAVVEFKPPDEFGPSRVSLTPVPRVAGEQGRTAADCAAKFDNAALMRGPRAGQVEPFHQLGADPAADAKLASDFKLPDVPFDRVSPAQRSDDVASLPGAVPIHGTSEPVCARCGLVESVHGHGETGREDSHPFEFAVWKE